MANARRDDNFVPVIQGLSNADGVTPLSPYVDSVTNRLLVSGIVTLVGIGDLATETTLAKTEAEVREYGINDIENASATITYIGKEDKDGNWLIVKIDTTTGYAISYATYLNNGTLAPNTYTHAWTDRATITYGDFNLAF